MRFVYLTNEASFATKANRLLIIERRNLHNLMDGEILHEI